MWSVKGQPSTSRLCEYISPHHPGAVQGLTFNSKPGLNSIGYALVWGASMLVCGDGTYPRVQLETAEHISKQQITSSRSVPYTVHQNALHGLIDVDSDAATCEWLLREFPDISFGYKVSH